MAIQGVSGYETVTVSTVAIGITRYMGGLKTRAALITVDTAPIIFTLDGTTPSATSGHQVAAGQTIELADQGQCKNFLAIRNSGVDAKLRVTHAVDWAL